MQRKKLRGRSVIVGLGVALSSLVLGQGGPSSPAGNGDVNCSGKTDISDPVFLLNYLFLGGEAPCRLPDPPELLSRMDHLQAELDAARASLKAAERRILELEVPGCMAPESPNFDCRANVDDGSCPFQMDIPGFVFIGDNDQGFPEYRHVGTTEFVGTDLIFVLLRGSHDGEIRFQMGSPNAECGREPNEGPVHEVRLSSYLIAKYECTQAAWEAVMGSKPSFFTSDPQLPVEQVSWNEIQEFGTRTGLQLPNEAQWEHACRGGTTTPFAPGETLDSVTQANFSGTVSSCNYARENGQVGGTTVVGSYAPNPLGLHDVHGNVYEWCQDVYDPDFYGRPEALGPDPVATSGSEYRVLRGGFWGSTAEFCRSAFRLRLDPASRFNVFGFRPSRPVP